MCAGTAAISAGEKGVAGLLVSCGLSHAEAHIVGGRLPRRGQSLLNSVDIHDLSNRFSMACQPFAPECAKCNNVTLFFA
jgi:hypothetical protein